MDCFHRVINRPRKSSLGGEQKRNNASRYIVRDERSPATTDRPSAFISPSLSLPPAERREEAEMQPVYLAKLFLRPWDAATLDDHAETGVPDGFLSFRSADSEASMSLNIAARMNLAEERIKDFDGRTLLGEERLRANEKRKTNRISSFAIRFIF